MSGKKKSVSKKKFVKFDGVVENKTFRITFQCSYRTYFAIRDEIEGYSKILTQEIEVEE